MLNLACPSVELGASRTYKGRDEVKKCLEAWESMAGSVQCQSNRDGSFTIKVQTKASYQSGPLWQVIASVVDITCSHVFKADTSSSMAEESKDYSMVAKGLTAEGKNFEIRFHALLCSDDCGVTWSFKEEYPEVTWL